MDGNQSISRELLMGLKDWLARFEDLVSEVPEDLYVEFLEEVEDRASSALAARREELVKWESERGE